MGGILWRDQCCQTRSSEHIVTLPLSWFSQGTWERWLGLYRNINIQGWMNWKWDSCRNGGEIRSCEIEMFLFFPSPFSWIKFLQLRTFEPVYRRWNRLTSLLNSLCFHAQAVAVTIILNKGIVQTQAMAYHAMIRKCLLWVKELSYLK